MSASSGLMGRDAPLLVTVELDVPGETRRQAHVFVVWLLCLATAVVVSVVRRPHIPVRARGSAEQEEIMSHYTQERFMIAAGLGIALPGLLTFVLTHRRRRGGPHARGIFVEATPTGELRVWGRGYGQRIQLDGAELSERLVDVFSGRLGAWRQRRLTIRANKMTAGMPSELELATVASDDDEELDIPLVGGEGNCLELSRDDYLRVLRRCRAWAAAARDKAS